jgi:hypothetical protein
MKPENGCGTHGDVPSRFFPQLMAEITLQQQSLRNQVLQLIARISVRDRELNLTDTNPATLRRISVCRKLQQNGRKMMFSRCRPEKMTLSRERVLDYLISRSPLLRKATFWTNWQSSSPHSQIVAVASSTDLTTPGRWTMEALYERSEDDNQHGSGWKISFQRLRSSR